jgi:hypothetical protein
MVCSWFASSELSMGGIHENPSASSAFSLLAPQELAGHSFAARLYCTPRALWKLNWFLRDFGYDIELLGRDEIDEKSLVGLRGVIKISYTVVNGTSLLNLDGFAPASQWEQLSSAAPASLAVPKSASTSPARAAIAIVILMAGKKEILEQRCFSGAPSNKL